jgi:predicted AAA+ superfamily ATPase
MRYKRYSKSLLEVALRDTPVVLLHGPRQSGKTTLAKEVGENKYHYLTFDDDTELAAAIHDPRGYIEDLPDFCILDEVQRVPELFPSIKMAVDRNRLPGRFLLTGSANVLAIPRLSESLAGRMEIINLRPLAQIEIEGRPCHFLEDAFNATLKANFENRLGDSLLERIISGGFPEPFQRSDLKRQRAWYTNYLDVLIHKDITEFANIHYAEEIPLLLKRVANNTANLVNISEINQGLSFDAKTAKSYINLLKQLFLIDTLPPWFSNRNKRLVKTPKIHIPDTGLLCALLKTSKTQLLADKTSMGPILESFIYSELRKQADWYEQDLEFFHYRDKNQNEVDIIIQNEEGSLIGFEVKLAASVSEKDFKGLKRFQEQYPSRMIGGYVFYDGERTLSFGENFKAVPIQALWG